MYAYTMSISLLIYWIITEMMPAVDSIPLKNGVSDPLESSPEIESSVGYLSNDMMVSILREAVDPEAVIKPQIYDGYLFNQNRCIQFNNRILCGYDKNKGAALDDYTMIDVGNGCRTRADRIECGYANPVLNINLRQPAVKNRGGPGEKDGNNQNHEKKHRHKGHHHKGGVGLRPSDGLDDTLPREAPTRTHTITDPTAPSVIVNRMKADSIENKLLNSASSKLLLKAEETSIDDIKSTTNTTYPTTSTTGTVKPLITTTTTTVKPTKRKSRLTSTSTQKASKSTMTKAILSTINITRTLPENSEANEISDGETIQRIASQEPVIKPKRRLLLSKLLPKLPKLPHKPTRTAVPKTTKNCGSTDDGAALRMGGSAEKNIKTSCVEQQDRVVCYDFKT